LLKSNKEKSSGYEGVSGMKNWMFKRECFDDQILENFLLNHNLQKNEYNFAQFREFAENSIESPIDFSPLIAKLQKQSSFGNSGAYAPKFSKNSSDYGIEK
jgi:hypothetical protein